MNSAKNNLKSLKSTAIFLADANAQIEILEHGIMDDFALVPFQQKFKKQIFSLYGRQALRYSRLMLAKCVTRPVHIAM